MLNVKKYRAASTREALEQIKNELGEHALVLETRQVRKSGFLGLGGGLQIEVSAAVPADAEARPAAKKKSVHSTSILNLTDDSPAAPSSKSADGPAATQPTRREPTAAHGGDETKSSLMAALSARAVTGNGFDTEGFRTLAEVAPHIDSVELSPDAPKVVHQKAARAVETVPAFASSSIATVAAAAAAVITEPQTAAAATTGSARELELLRAELREIKFSVNNFANRPSAGFVPKDTDVDIFDDMFESPFYETYMELAETGIPGDLARTIVHGIVPHYRERRVEASELAYAALFNNISSTVGFVPDALHGDAPSRIAVIGATGVGKTTTIAKLAARAALKDRRRVELVTLDTYRIAAVEQLKTYAEIIGAGCHVVRTVLELDGLVRRLPEDSLVLIDTTGKNPHDLADQYELSDYLRAKPEIRKCLAVQSTTHPLDAGAAIRKFEMYGADSLILTKLDETLRPGALLEIVNDASLPVAYLCHGQRVPEDIQTATPDAFTNRILGKH